MIERVLVATDLSPACDVALAHGVRVAAAAGGALRVVHVEAPGAERGGLDAMPRVRELLRRWRDHDAARLGHLDVVKAVVRARDPVAALLEEVAREPPDLLVLGKHAYGGLGALLHRDVALAVARRARVAAWLFPDGSRGVVRPDDGAVDLRRVLVAAAEAPAPAPAVALVEDLAGLLGAADVVGTLTRIGDAAPGAPPSSGAVRWQVARRDDDDVVGGVAAAVDDAAADLLALTSAWRQSAADHLLGSTTERIVRGARVPVLVAPAAGAG